MIGTQLLASHKFLATFVLEEIPDPIDIAFSSVSGLGRGVGVSSTRQGGDNITEYHYVNNTQREALRLTRGVMQLTPLTLLLNDVMSDLTQIEMHVIVAVLGQSDIPKTTWTFEHVIPTGWRVGELNASTSTLLINSFEFVYRDVFSIGSHA